MELQFAFIGGDERMKYAKDLIAAANYPVTSYLDPAATHLVLPLPAFQKDGNITGGPAITEILPYIQGKIILGGKLDAQGEHLFQKAAQIIDYFTDEALTAGNAEITAEGALELAMANLPTTLSGTSMLVVGWGRIGQLLARKLQALGANITVSARKPRDLGLIQAFGFRPEETGLYRHGLSDYRVIFNTVPAMVFSPAQAAKIPSRCLYIELASQPGLDPSLLQKRQFLNGSGLPGKAAPERAGMLIGQTILRLIQNNSNH